MEKISINKNGLGIFQGFKKTNKIAERAVNSTNPFGISFKGSAIQADLFEKTANASIKTLGNSIAEKGKMVTSAIVGNLNAFRNSIRNRFDGVVAFGRRIRDNITNFWTKANNINVTEGLRSSFTNLSNKIKSVNEYSVNNLTKRPVNELSDMLKAELSV